MTRLLIVDDNEQNLYMLQVLLRGHGYEVVSASNGAEGLDIARRDPPDVIISDILMPVVDGFTLCREWKKDEQLRHIPFVFYTATYTDPKDEEFALSLGAEQFIVKPVEPDAFVEMLRETLEEHEAGRLVAPRAPVEEETPYLREYSEVLIRKLEHKIVQLERANRRLAALYQASTDMASVKPSSELVLHALRTVTQAMGYDQANYYALDQESHELRLLEAIGFSDEVTATFRRELVFTVGEPRGLVGLVGQTREPLIVADTTSDPRWVTLDASIRSALFVPVVHESRLLGVATCLSSDVGAFKEEDARDMMTIANNVAIAIENARLFERVERSERRYRTILESSADAIMSLDPDRRIAAWSTGAEQIFDYTKEEIIGQSLHILVPEHDRQATAEMLQEVRRSGAVRDWQTQRRAKDGQLVDVEITATHLGPELGFTAILRDITDRKRAEEALRESQTNLRTLFDSLEDFLFVLDVEGHVLEVNPVVLERLGYSKAELLGENVLKVHPPDRRDEAATIIADMVAGKADSCSIPLMTKDGALIPVETRVTQGRWSNQEVLFGVSRDVTQRLQLEEQLRQAQKMESIGQLAGGIAHDFNNLLTVINGFADLILPELSPSDPMRKDVASIRQAGQSASEITQQLLAFSRKQIIQPRILDLNQLVANMEPILWRTIREDIGIEMSLAPDLWRVKVDPTQIEQVIMNLAANARDAMPLGGELTIKTANVLLDKEYVAHYLGATPGKHVMLAISDTGIGMNQELRSHIFEPFFTTKAVGKGTGMGLATVYGIVKQSGGNIWCYSEEGEGTTFKIYLPSAVDESQVSVPREDEEEIPTGTEVILLVEDDATVRGLALRMLENAGYTVLEARDVEDALDQTQQHPGPIHVLLSDVVMPGMSGRDLADRITQMRPDVKVVYMSGYADEAIAHHGVLGPDTAFVQKPFSAISLLRKVREVLEQ